MELDLPSFRPAFRINTNTTMRSFLRDTFFSVLAKALNHDVGRKSMVDGLGSLLIPPGNDVERVCLPPLPYAELSEDSENEILTNNREDILILTGRFRSGSTLLWNLFRQLGEFTSYYEPFNERKWFDEKGRGVRVDQTHVNVTDYWREYDGLQSLSEFYDEDWIRRRLFMEESAFDERMFSFICALIESAPKRPVLQFNRLDFRLPWIRRHFPNAKILHLFRHARDQWCSTLMGNSTFGPHDGSYADFIKNGDRFYLGVWVSDLKYHFPFLENESIHPYAHFYWLWRLSHAYGVKYSDLSLRFEDILQDPRTVIGRVAEVGNFQIDNWTQIESILVKPKLGKWRDYAEESWFERIEAECEKSLRHFFKSSYAR